MRACVTKFALHHTIPPQLLVAKDPASRLTSKLDQLLSYMSDIDHWQHANKVREHADRGTSMPSPPLPAQHRYKMMMLERDRKKQVCFVFTRDDLSDVVSWICVYVSHRVITAGGLLCTYKHHVPP